GFHLRSPTSTHCSRAQGTTTARSSASLRLKRQALWGNWRSSIWNMGQRLAGGRRGRGAASARLAELLPGVDHGDALHDGGMVRIQDVGPRGRVRVGEAGGGEL